ncbi:MAG TPA: TetR/AcrR family transcriptional regulator [Polyangiales bacterium]|nr:TetR/AcrR family transcriptional regulator [Polyangiales bacterium]
MKKPRKTAYHHGNLRRALLDAALELVSESGVGTLSLREVARRAEVSHAAPAHHFRDKAGLLTALATEGFERFGAALRAGADRAEQPSLRFAWTGWAYVMFAAEHRAYFAVMFRPELLRYDDPELARAAVQAYQVLRDCVKASGGAQQSEQDLEVRAIRAWAEVHGLATLWLDGNLQQYGSRDQLDALVKKIYGLA